MTQNNWIVFIVIVALFGIGYILYTQNQVNKNNAIKAATKASTDMSSSQAILQAINQ